MDFIGILFLILEMEMEKFKKLLNSRICWILSYIWTKFDEALKVDNIFH